MYIAAKILCYPTEVKMTMRIEDNEFKLRFLFDNLILYRSIIQRLTVDSKQPFKYIYQHIITPIALRMYIL